MYAENHAIVFQHFEWVRQKKMKNSKLAFPELYFFLIEGKRRRGRREEATIMSSIPTTIQGGYCVTHIA